MLLLDIRASQGQARPPGQVQHSPWCARLRSAAAWVNLDLYARRGDKLIQLQQNGARQAAQYKPLLAHGTGDAPLQCKPGCWRACRATAGARKLRHFVSWPVDATPAACAVPYTPRATHATLRLTRTAAGDLLGDARVRCNSCQHYSAAAAQVVLRATLTPNVISRGSRTVAGPTEALARGQNAFTAGSNDATSQRRV